MTVTQIEQKLRAKLEADQAYKILGNRIHNVIAEVLKNFVGKKLTKRFTDKVDAALAPLFPVKPATYWAGPGKLYFWGNGVSYDQRLVFYIAGEKGYLNPGHSIAHPTLEGFEHEDQCHGKAAAERIAERATLLRDKAPGGVLHTLAIKIFDLREAKASFRSLTEPFELGLRHEAERIVDEQE